MKRKIWLILLTLFTLSIILSGTALATTYSTTFWGATVYYSIGWTEGFGGNAHAYTSWGSIGGYITSQIALTYFDSDTGFNSTKYYTRTIQEANTVAQAWAYLNSHQDTISGKSYHCVEYRNDGWSTHLYLP